MPHKTTKGTFMHVQISRSAFDADPSSFRDIAMGFFPEGIPSVGDRCVFICQSVNVTDDRLDIELGLVPIGPETAASG
jgi:hypothetical protein